MLKRKVEKHFLKWKLCRNDVEVSGKVSYLPFYMAICLGELSESRRDDFVLAPGWD